MRYWRHMEFSGVGDKGTNVRLKYNNADKSGAPEPGSTCVSSTALPSPLHRAYTDNSITGCAVNQYLLFSRLQPQICSPLPFSIL